MNDTRSPIEWTRQRRGLWTGRRDGAPAGTIEEGARYAFVDLDGTAHGRYRTLSDAQTAATTPSTATDGGASARGRWAGLLLLAGAAFALLLGITTLVVALVLV